VNAKAIGGNMSQKGGQWMDGMKGRELGETGPQKMHASPFIHFWAYCFGRSKILESGIAGIWMYLSYLNWTKMVKIN